ncbi:MAG: aspartate aminotransferase family protein, partial [FCB group bacterium]|nr:aspartate aminotransferase family protein [FCB group bacterium]
MDDKSINSKSQKHTNEEIYKQACKVLPGGVSRNTVFHKPHPYYVAKASGCYVIDIDGIQRIDFANNMASLIHGHANPQIVDAVTEQLRKGTAYTMATEAEVAFAQLLCDRVPSFDKIRFMNSGTEAVMAMIKASRAYTGRAKIAKAEGAYHGTYDFAEISQTANPSNWGDVNKPNSVPLANGTPQGVLDDVVIFPFNDIERAISILDQNAENIACVLIDPVPHRVGLIHANTDFIEAMYKWTRKNGALLVFDEVVTLRVNYSGAQDNYSVKPDLTALGKMIGGGFPVGALAGRAEIMKVLDPSESKLLFPHSGTFSANPITMIAGRVAMELFDEEAVLKLNALTQKAINQIKEAIKLVDIPISITGAGSMFRIHLTAIPPTSYREAFQTKEAAILIRKLLDYLFISEKIMMVNTCTCMFSTAITQKEV